MAVVNTGNFAKAIYPGVSKWFGETYKDWDKIWKQVFQVEGSKRAFEEDVGTSMFGLAPVKVEGQSVSYDTAQQGYVTRYNHLVYALGFIITREMYDDDLYGVIGKKRSQALARSINITVETVAANVFNRAFNSSYTGGDGVSLANTAHPNKFGGTYSNKLSTDADISEAALEQACIDIMNFTDDRGLRIMARPKKIMVPTASAFEIERILKSVLQPDSANHNVNALKNKNAIPEGYVVNPFLSDTGNDQWHIITDVNDGLKAYVRDDVEFATDNDSDTENAKFKARWRGSFLWSDPRGVYSSSGA